MNYKYLKMSCFFSLILTGCTPSPAYSSGVSASNEESSLSFCKNTSSTPEEAIEVFSSGQKRCIYVWESDCGEIRCAFHNGAIASEGAPRYEFFLDWQNGFSCSLEEGAACVNRYLIESYDFFVFEIPGRINQEIYDDLSRNPYAYFCQRKDVYDRLGLSLHYKYNKDYGYIDPTPSLDVAEWTSMSPDDFKTADPLAFESYIVMTSGRMNHIFTVEGGSLTSHIETPFVFFDPDVIDGTVGLDFVGLVRKCGAPSFVSDEGRCAVEYVYNSYAYIVGFTKDGPLLKVSSIERKNLYYSLYNNGELGMIDADIVSDLSEYTSVSALIRKTGKTGFMVHGSTIRYAYCLDDGSYLVLRFDSYPRLLTFDYNQRGWFAWQFNRYQEAPDWLFVNR